MDALAGYEVNGSFHDTRNYESESGCDMTLLQMKKILLVPDG